MDVSPLDNDAKAVMWPSAGLVRAAFGARKTSRHMTVRVWHSHAIFPGHHPRKILWIIDSDDASQVVVISIPVHAELSIMVCTGARPRSILPTPPGTYYCQVYIRL